MARSVRKAPFVSITNAPSEKEDKQRANRRVKQGHPDTRPDDISNASTFGKDGCRRINPLNSPKLMRK